MVMENGDILEKAGCNMTKIKVPLSRKLLLQMNTPDSLKNISEDLMQELVLYACGLNLVFHPKNPHVPITH